MIEQLIGWNQFTYYLAGSIVTLGLMFGIVASWGFLMGRMIIRKGKSLLIRVTAS